MFPISIPGTEVFLLAPLVSVCDMCLSGDKSVLCDKQEVVMHSLQAPVSPRTCDSQEQDAQEQLYSPGSSRQTRTPEFYHLTLFGFGSEKAVLYTEIYGGERLVRDPKPLGSKW